MPAVWQPKNFRDMVTRFKLWDGRKVTVEQTMTGYEAQYDGESEKKRITSKDYMRLVLTGNIIERI